MNDSAMEMKEVVLRDVESVLRQTIGHQMVVENCTTNSLLPPGENYGSSIFSVDVELKDKNNGKKEDLHLIAKMVPPTEFQRQLFNSSRTFIKEIFMYDNIIPTYNRLELDCGFKENELFNITPKFYGSRLSMKSTEEFDDNAVILMENLKAKGYYTGDRSKGYDLAHGKMAVKALARFHALGIAVKQKRPGIFKVFKMYAKQFQGGDVGGDLFKSILARMKEDSEINPYYDRCYEALMKKSIEEFWSDSCSEPWTTIVHSDFWVNNVMYHRNDKGDLDDIKFIDFQIYLLNSPLRDLLFFLYSSLELTITEEEIDNMIDMYYETFINTLNKMGCDTDGFSKEGFQEKMKEDAEYEFTHTCFMIKIITVGVKDVKNFDFDKMHDVLIDYAGNELFAERLRRVVFSYIKRDWI